jgi:hypothetical protein
MIHVYMEMSQGNSLLAILNKQKYHFSFYSFTNIGGEWNRSCLGWELVPVGRVRRWERI